VREDRCQSAVGDFAISVTRPPMDLMMMAASLEAIGIECKIKDYPIEGGDWDTFRKDFLKFTPELLVVSTTTPTLKHDLLSCAIAKEINPKTLTIAKGAHFLIYDYETMEEFNDLDIIIRGENELVIKEIASNGDLTAIKGISYRDNGQIKRNNNRPFLENLDELPVPARHLVKNELYTRPDTSEPMAVIETSRGCPGSCIFCLVGQVAGKKIRNRSAVAIIDEIEECISKHNISNFHFKSDTFTWNKNWVLELCNEILKRKLQIKWICNSRVDTLDRELLPWMKKAGCWAIGLGIESGNQDILDRIKKGIKLEQARQAINICKEFGVKTYAYFIIGFPWDNEKTINDSMQFAIDLNPDFVDFFLPYPFPGTELEGIAKEYGLIDGPIKGRAYSQSIMATQSLSKDKLLSLRKIALKRFYMRWGFILKTLFTAKSPKVIWNYFCYGIKTVRKLN
jgi:anaerobic magnesium-protoporphyrin IX monomethyl ester cyclase